MSANSSTLFQMSLGWLAGWLFLTICCLMNEWTARLTSSQIGSEETGVEGSF